MHVRREVELYDPNVGLEAPRGDVRHEVELYDRSVGLEASRR